MTRMNHDRASGIPSRRHVRAAALPVLLVAALALPACGIMDVENPNNLVEENVHQRTAASAVVNGALSLLSQAASAMWQPYLMVSDELVWIGSRDAWQALDFGFVNDPNNEFVDESFPLLGSARWMADEAVKILDAHVEETPTAAMKFDQARAYLFAGMIYTVIGEIQEDYAFSHKREPAPPVGPENMSSVLDDAIAWLDRSLAIAQEIGDADLQTRILAVRARAKHSRAVWDKIKPSPSTSSPLVSAAGANQDAQAVLARVSGDWTYKLTFSSATISNVMASWINSRAENQFGFSIVEVEPTAVKQIRSVALQDPIDGIPDPVITAKLLEWKSGDLSAAGNIYPPLTFASARMMHLILAEDALARQDDTGFATQINAVREMDGLTPYSGQIPARDMLVHERRVNLFLMGLRLVDMYRFGIKDPMWQPNSDAVTKPGTLLPITIIERRANPFLSSGG